MSIAEKLITISENVQNVYNAGKAKRDYEWWDNYQTEFRGMSYAQDRSTYLYAFAGSAWDDTNYNPIRTIKASKHSGFLYASSMITDTKVAIDISSADSTNKSYTFQNAASLVTIRKLIINENTKHGNQFTGCSKLKNITIEGKFGNSFSFKDSPLFTKESILSVYNALSDAVSGMTATFSATAVGKAFETSAGMADGSSSAEWNAMVANKPNWTFALA